MKSIGELINDYYSEFVGLPTTKPIVRQNQVDDENLDRVMEKRRYEL